MNEPIDEDPLLVGLVLVGNALKALQTENVALRLALKDANEHLQRLGWNKSGGTDLRDRIAVALKRRAR